LEIIFLKKQTLKYLCSALALFSFLGPPSLFAEEKKLTAVFTTWEPYGYLEDDKPVGYEIEIFRAVAGRMGIEVTFLNRPWKRCLHMVKTGRADVVISALDVVERREFMIYPDEHISVNETALFTHIDKNITFDGSLETLKGLTIGTTSGFSYAPAFDKAMNLKRVENSSVNNLVRRLLMGSLDLGIANVLVANRMAKKNDAEGKIKFLKPLIHSKKLYACFSKSTQHHTLAKEFSEALRSFKKTDSYKLIRQKYGML